MPDLLGFVTARLDDEQRGIEEHRCIHCGNRTAPLRNLFGVVGYTHDGWDREHETWGGWEGRRCPNRLTGAEPVQRPDRALAEIEIKRRIVVRHMTGYGRDYGQRCTNSDHIQEWQCERAGCAYDEIRWCEACPDEPCELQMLAGLWAEHIDFQQVWAESAGRPQPQPSASMEG